MFIKYALPFIMTDKSPQGYLTVPDKMIKSKILTIKNKDLMASLTIRRT